MSEDNPSLQDMITAFEERMNKKREQEEADQKKLREKLRAEYMWRTGRTEMKP
jgi:hypothetical protein